MPSHIGQEISKTVWTGILLSYVCISLYIDLLQTRIHTKSGQIFDVLVYKESCLNGVAFACKVIKTLHPSFNHLNSDINIMNYVC